MNLTNIWMTLFKTTTLWGLDMGFWVSMAAVILIVVVENIDMTNALLKPALWPYCSFLLYWV